MRAIAAVSVLLYHASAWLNKLRHESFMLGVFSGWFGVFGVKLFFAISGYLMAELALVSTPGRFLAHRVLRVYPIYWMSIGAAILLFRIGHIYYFLDPLTLFLVPGLDSGFTLGIEWTLPFELSFYFIVFLFVLVQVQDFLPLFAVSWIATILAIPAFGIIPGLQQGATYPSIVQLPFTVHCLPFAGGLLIPLAIRKGLVKFHTGVIGVVLAFSAPWMPQQPEFLSTLTISAGCVLIVAFSARPLPAAKGPELQALSSLGDWSYALYLCHVPILICYYKLAPDWTQPFLLWLVAVTSAMIISVAWGKTDVRLYGYLKRWVDRSPDFVATAISALFVVGFFTVESNVLQQKREDDLYQQNRRKIVAYAAEFGDRLSKQILREHQNGSVDLAAEVERLGWRRSEDLIGSLDDATVESTWIRIQGWALDRTGGAPDVFVLIFRGGRYLGTAVPQLRWKDVEAAIGISAIRPGYVAFFQINGGCTGAMLATLIVNPTKRDYAIVRSDPKSVARNTNCTKADD